MPEIRNQKKRRVYFHLIEIQLPQWIQNYYDQRTLLSAIKRDLFHGKPRGHYGFRGNTHKISKIWYLDDTGI